MASGQRYGTIIVERHSASPDSMMYSQKDGSLSILNISDCGVPDTKVSLAPFSAGNEAVLESASLSADEYKVFVTDRSDYHEYFDLSLLDDGRVYYDTLSWACFDSTHYEPNLLINGATTQATTKSRLPGVQITVMSEDTLIIEHLSSEIGLYSLELGLDQVLDLTYSLKGYYTKRLRIDTRYVDPWKVATGFSMTIDMSMEPLVDNISIAALDKPLSICAWSKAKGNFDWDFGMATKAQEAINSALGR